MVYPSSVADIEGRMTTLATSARCRKTALAHATIEGRTVSYLEIAPATATSATPVAMFVGGLHSREWAPPDALLSFAERLVQAADAGTTMHYPAFRDGPVRYASSTVNRTDVQRFVDDVVIIILPMANPDGRNHSLTRNTAGDTGPQGARWRGNRRVSGPGSCVTHGVDLNRNFASQWDLNPYYTSNDETWILTNGARGTCDPDPAGDPIFRGASAASEPETQNVQELVDTFRPQFFMDTHSYGRSIALPWGVARNQSATPSQNFGNAALDRTAAPGSGRDVIGGTYEEYVPDTADIPLQRWQRTMATHMIDTIRSQAGADATARARSTYTAVPTVDFYLPYFPGISGAPLPGACDDYAFGRPFRANEPMAFACTLECGYATQGEMGFFPPTGVKYEKIEREVHAAMWALLDVASGFGVPGTGAPL
ncbi:MAG: M14 family zinc carboxypeptidase [Ornithinibacter sp.]